MSSRIPLLTLILAAALTGCMLSPTNNYTHEDIDEPIAFAAVTPGPNDLLQFQIESQASPGSWETFASYRTAATPTATDVKGTKWYLGGESLPLPFSRTRARNWKLDTSNSSQRRVWAQFRTVSPAESSDDLTLYLGSFDYGATCAKSTYDAEGGMAALNKCQSANSPNAKVYVKCGKENQACCYNAQTTGWCDNFQLECNHTTKKCWNPGKIGKAFVTRTNTSDANACVDNMAGQFGDAPLLALGRKSKNFRLPDPTNGLYGAGDHNQGIALLNDVTINGQRYGRAAVSFTANDSTGFAVSGVPVGSTTEAIYSTTGTVNYMSSQRKLDIVDVAAYGNHTHPGGMQAVGNFVAVAMEQQVSDGRAAVYFLRVDGLTPSYVTTKTLEGEPVNMDVNRKMASAAGIVKLADGGYLLAVSGSNYGLAGVWFFITEDPISANMRWRYIDFWRPSELGGGACDIEEGKISSDCFVGGGGATALVNDCDGNIYLVVTNGTAGWGYDDEFAQAFRVTQASDNNVKLTNIWNSKRKIGQVSIDVPSHRWGAGAAVTNKNKLVLLSSERGTNDGDNASVDGYLRIAGENNTGL